MKGYWFLGAFVFHLLFFILFFVSEDIQILVMSNIWLAACFVMGYMPNNKE